MALSIEVTDLVVRYPSGRGSYNEAVSGLGFEVHEGEIVGFLGPNGAGKSSTLKALMGFVPATSGQSSVFGYPAGSVEARALTGYLPEVAMYYPYMTPLETLCFYGELQGMRGAALKREACEMLDLLGLSKWMKTQNRKLSKGMLQRVGVGQALLGSPKLLILDEVTSGLDPLGRQDLRELLKERQRNGTTLFFSSHELSEVESLCDRILIVNRGKLIDHRELAPLQEELRQFAIVFDCAAPIMFFAKSIEHRGDLTFATFSARAQLVEAIDCIQKGKGTIVDVISREGSLESYFIETLRKAA